MDPFLDSFADFAHELEYHDLPANAIGGARERILDALDCALGAFN